MFADFCKNSPKLAGVALISGTVIFAGGIAFATVYNAIKGGSLSLSKNGFSLSGFSTPNKQIATTSEVIEAK